VKLTVLLAALGLVWLSSGLPAQEHKPEALAQANLGLALSRQQKYHEAIEAYRRAITIDPALPGLYLNLGLAYFKLGDFHEAVTALEKQNATSPSQQAQTLLAMSHFGLGEYREAAGLLKPAAAAQPGNTELTYLLAKCYVWSGQYDEASLFKDLLRRDPDSAAAHMLLGEALDAQRRTAEAITEFEAAAKAAPAQPDIHFGLGYLYWEQRRFEDAEREFREELKQNTTSGQASAYLGDVLLRSGQKEEALARLQAAARLRPDLHVAHVDLGILYAGDRKYDVSQSDQGGSQQLGRALPPGPPLSRTGQNGGGGCRIRDRTKIARRENRTAADEDQRLFLAMRFLQHVDEVAAEYGKRPNGSVQMWMLEGMRT
jgi:tetratricopeptide (TPR) repeat protein